jgi:hypothetical protein
MAKPIQEAITILKDAKQQINKLLNGPEHNQNLLEINANFTRIENRLGFMGGVLEPTETKQEARKRFPPMTSFMGQKLETVKKFNQDDLTPSESTKKKYLASVNKLWNEIGNFTPDHLLKSYRIENDIKILRGVANRAGVQDFETAELNIEFIDKVQKAVAAKNKEKSKQAKIDNNVKSAGENKTAKKPEEAVQ